MTYKLTKMIAKTFLIVIIINLLYANAQEFSGETFADYLFREGEYYRAITEYYRLLHTVSDSSMKAGLLRKVGLCYLKGADYDGYILFFEKNQTNFYRDPLLYNEMNLYLGKSYYHLNHYKKGITKLDSQQLNPSNQFFNDFQFLLAISYSRMYDWQNAIQKLQSINQDHSDVDKIKANNMILSLQKFPNLSHRSPFLAGGLSAIIPGAGYAYCHRWGTGIASFLVNGLLVWTFSDALKKEQYGLASLTGFVGIGWYVGNIKGSAKAAKKYNSHIRKDFIDNILRRENLLEYVKN
jgi:tetratricopeptide (TPR) repeat protein